MATSLLFIAFFLSLWFALRAAVAVILPCLRHHTPPVFARQEVTAEDYETYLSLLESAQKTSFTTIPSKPPKPRPSIRNRIAQRRAQPTTPPSSSLPQPRPKRKPRNRVAPEKISLGNQTFASHEPIQVTSIANNPLGSSSSPAPPRTRINVHSPPPAPNDSPSYLWKNPRLPVVVDAPRKRRQLLTLCLIPARVALLAVLIVCSLTLGFFWRRKPMPDESAPQFRAT
jgi:hypothetical protein